MNNKRIDIIKCIIFRELSSHLVSSKVTFHFFEGFFDTLSTLSSIVYRVWGKYFRQFLPPPPSPPPLPDVCHFTNEYLKAIKK